MHADEVDTDAGLVGRLIATQFPDWAELPVEPVAQRGTDNALYRLGEKLVVRLPGRERPSIALQKEVRWLPHLAPQLPLAVPVPVATGAPAEGFPFPWAVYTWLPGENATPERVGDVGQAATDLAEFIAALQRIDASDGPTPDAHNVGRGEPLAERDEDARNAIAKVGSAIDAELVTASWETALAAPEWDRPGVWLHGDLDSRNLLALGGRISAALDWGCLGVGDPACDVMVAWKMLDADARERFRSELAVDDATWARAGGWALSQAVGALSYYTTETNPVLFREAERWLAEVLADGTLEP
jgi:aminoglycoside phosphotransferase (APT) family kinase protein